MGLFSRKRATTAEELALTLGLLVWTWDRSELIGGNGVPPRQEGDLFLLQTAIVCEVCERHFGTHGAETITDHLESAHARLPALVAEIGTGGEAARPTDRLEKLMWAMKREQAAAFARLTGECRRWPRSIKDSTLQRMVSEAFEMRNPAAEIVNGFELACGTGADLIGKMRLATMAGHLTGTIRDLVAKLRLV